MNYAWLDAPCARVQVAADQAGVRSVYFAGGRYISDPPPEDWNYSPRALREPLRQLQAWFRGDLTQFELPLAPEGTDFQQAVWDVLTTIPYGETMTYGEVACAIGQPAAARAVGAANGRNPISIIVPCHRVIGASGKLVGFGGGLDVKRWLLRHEQQHLVAAPDASPGVLPFKS